MLYVHDSVISRAFTISDKWKPCAYQTSPSLVQIAVLYHICELVLLTMFLDIVCLLNKQKLTINSTPIMYSVRNAIAKADDDNGEDDFLSLRVKTKEDEVQSEHVQSI